jgi:mono/diheme cytochrome c family protein
MKKALKWISIVLGGLVGLLVLAVIILFIMGGSKTGTVYNVPQETITVPTDAETMAQGEVLANISGCTSCHVQNLSGETFFDDAVMGTLAAPNLTSGQGGLGSRYTDTDWERAIRHGVRPDGTGLLIMPSQHFAHYSDEDVAALIAYLKSVPPVDNELPSRALGPMGRTLLVLGAFQLTPEMIDHTTPHASSAPSGVTEERGHYLTEISVCADCHGEGLVGRAPEEAEEGPPAGPNLTPGGDLAAWSEADFIQTIRTGVTPAGNQLDPMEMPWPAYSRFSDEDLTAIYLYLQSLPPTPTQQAN